MCCLCVYIYFAKQLVRFGSSVCSLFARSYYSPPPPRPTAVYHSFYFCLAESMFSHAMALYYIKISPLKIFQDCSVLSLSCVHSLIHSFFIYFSLVLVGCKKRIVVMLFRYGFTVCHCSRSILAFSSRLYLFWFVLSLFFSFSLSLPLSTSNSIRIFLVEKWS